MDGYFIYYPPPSLNHSIEFTLYAANWPFAPYNVEIVDSANCAGISNPEGEG